MKPSAAKAHLLSWPMGEEIPPTSRCGVRGRLQGTAEAEKIRAEVDMIDYNKKLVYKEEIEEDSKLSGNPSILGRSRAQCSGIVRTFRHNNNTLLSRGAAVF